MTLDNGQLDQKNIAGIEQVAKQNDSGKKMVKLKVSKTIKKKAIKPAKNSTIRKGETKIKVAEVKKGANSEIKEALPSAIIRPAQPFYTSQTKLNSNFAKPDDFIAAKEELKRELAASGNIATVKAASNAKLEEKKYFDVHTKTATGLVSQTATAKKAEPMATATKTKTKRPLRLYRNIALTFMIATIILVAVIGYFAFVRVSITIIPNQENVSDNLIFDVYDQEKNTAVGGNAILGVVKKINVKIEKNYPATGEEIIGQEVVGTTTIINNYDKSQPLVATTRLLAPDGKLFRIKETVNIPAGGSIIVPIYADQPSKEMAISPTRFTIPGLWAGLQDKIYAQNDQPFVYQQKIKRQIVSEDIANSKIDLKQAIIDKALVEVGDTYKDLGKVICSIDEKTINTQTNSKVGIEKDNFTSTMSADVAVVAFNAGKAGDLAKQKFILSLQDNKEVISFNENNIVYTVNNSDLERGVATLNASFEGKITLKEGSNIVDVNKVLGLNKDQLKAYLTSLPDVAGYEIKFTPSWLWTVPTFIESSKIQVEIKK